MGFSQDVAEHPYGGIGEGRQLLVHVREQRSRAGRDMQCGGRSNLHERKLRRTTGRTPLSPPRLRLDLVLGANNNTESTSPADNFRLEEWWRSLWALSSQSGPSELGVGKSKRRSGIGDAALTPAPTLSA